MPPARTAMGSGAALLMTILAGARLWSSLLIFGVYGVSVACYVWRGAPAPLRAKLLQRFKVGALAGALATAGYDLSRYALVSLGGLDYWPFESFVHFGRSIAGSAEISRAQAYLIGTIYHCWNGVFFAIAYATLFGGPPWLLGVIYSMVLEMVVFTLYPGWLNLSAVYAEFTLVSLLGHITYGTVLGITCQTLVRRPVPENAASGAASR